MPNTTSIDEQLEKMASVEVERGRLQARGFIMELEEAGLLNKEASRAAKASAVVGTVANNVANFARGAGSKAYGGAVNTGRAVSDKQLRRTAKDAKTVAGDMLNPKSKGYRMNMANSFIGRNQATVNTVAGGTTALGGGAAIALNKKASANTEAFDRLQAYLNA